MDVINNLTESIDTALENVNTTMVVIAVVVLLIVFFIIFKSSIKFILKLLINTLVGFFLLFVFNKLGAFIGISLAVNWLNAVVAGVLGLPGIALLLILQWLSVI